MTESFFCNIMDFVEWRGILAQLGEHLPYKQRVIGSSPIGPTFSQHSFGGIAQLARAHGSYPWCRWFKSSSRYFLLYKMHEAWRKRRICLDTPFLINNKKLLCNVPIIQSGESSSRIERVRSGLVRFVLHREKRRQEVD